MKKFLEVRSNSGRTAVSQSIVNYVMNLIERDAAGRKVGVLATGIGGKYENLYKMFMAKLNESQHLWPTNGVIEYGTIALGLPMRKETATGKITSDIGTVFTRVEWLKDFFTPDQIWQNMQKIDEMETGFKILTTGRQLVSALLNKESFKEDSVWGVDWQNRRLIQIVYDGRSVWPNL